MPLRNSNRLNQEKSMQLKFLFIQIRRWLMQPHVWRFVGFASTAIGLLCHALSSSFIHLFGEWSLIKISVYSVFCIIICFVILFAKVWQQLRSLHFEAHMAFFILTITSLYSFFFDKAVKGKPDAYSLVSHAAFSVTSLSLSRQSQTHFGFEVDLLYFFLGCLIVQFMKLNLWLGFVGAGFSYSLIILRLSLEAPARDTVNTVSQDQHHLVVQVNSQQAQQPNNTSMTFIEPRFLQSIEELRWANLAIVNFLKCLLSKYLVDKDDQIPMVLVNDKNFLMDELPPQAIWDLQEDVKYVIRRGFENVCLDEYSNWRREFLQLAEKELGTEGTDEKERIKSWIKVSNVSLRILFPNERRLCDRVFLGFSSLADRAFMQVCSGFTTDLLNFADAFANSRHSLNRLPGVLQMFGELRELIPEFQSVFCDQHSVSIATKAIMITKRLEEAIREMFMMLEDMIRCDTKQAVVPGGICPITAELMNHLSAFGEGKSSLFSLEATRIIVLLENHLEAKAKNYTNPALGFVFLMNNERYIEIKARQYQLGTILGNDCIQQRTAKVRQNFEHYRRSSWDEVLGLLKLRCNESMKPDIEEAESMKEKLSLFNLQFKDIWRDQGAWFVNDEELREEIIKSLEKILSQAYGLFLWSFNSVLGDHAEEYIRYSVLDIKDLLKDLFEGKDE